MKPLSSSSDNTTVNTCTLGAYTHKYEHWETQGGLTLFALQCQNIHNKAAFPSAEEWTGPAALEADTVTTRGSHCKAPKQKGRGGLGDRGAAKHRLTLSQSQSNASGLREAPR